jgi:hypothetical protein
VYIYIYIYIYTYIYILAGRGWWTGAEREETLVTRNPKKMWLGYAIVGPKETLGTHFTCFTRATVQILTLKRRVGPETRGAQFSCFTSTKGQILTLKAAEGAARRVA